VAAMERSEFHWGWREEDGSEAPSGRLSIMNEPAHTRQRSEAPPLPITIHTSGPPLEPKPDTGWEAIFFENSS
jgi:hypothetical protein